MNCYLHPTAVAVATCKSCGANMCEKCFEHSEHSGLCPECRKQQLRAELAEAVKKRRSRRIVAAFWTVIALLLACAVAALCMYCYNPIVGYFESHGKIVFIVITGIAAIFPLGALCALLASVKLARAYGKKCDRLEYSIEKMNRVMRSARRNSTPPPQSKKEQKALRKELKKIK